MEVLKMMQEKNSSILWLAPAARTKLKLKKMESHCWNATRHCIMPLDTGTMTGISWLVGFLRCTTGST
uniref:Uncharacterized protein n=1 Tax=Trichogramma kaykai TaxID=54128 RepID=A0ABD2X336_9HYME